MERRGEESISPPNRGFGASRRSERTVFPPLSIPLFPSDNRRDTFFEYVFNRRLFSHHYHLNASKRERERETTEERGGERSIFLPFFSRADWNSWLMHPTNSLRFFFLTPLVNQVEKELFLFLFPLFSSDRCRGEENLAWNERFSLFLILFRRRLGIAGFLFPFSFF